MISSFLSNDLLKLINERIDFDNLDPLLEKHLSFIIDISSSEYNNNSDVIDITSFPNINDFLTHINEQQHSGDFWEAANAGDIVVKDGHYYVSGVPNGSHFIVKRNLGGAGTDIEYLSPYCSLGVLCYPEEFRTVGNINDKINDYLSSKEL